jgi:hypothetical protein
MPEMITVNQDKLEVVRGLAQDSIITCTKAKRPRRLCRRYHAAGNNEPSQRR